METIVGFIIVFILGHCDRFPVFSLMLRTSGSGMAGRKIGMTKASVARVLGHQDMD